MSRSTDPITMAQLLLHTPQDGVENIGWLSQFGNNIRVSFAREYIENPNRLTLSQVFTGGNEAQTLEILRARDDERLVRIARLPGYFGNLLPEGHNRDRLAERRGVDANDEFELLAAAGHDLIGALKVVPGNNVPPEVLELHVPKGLEPLEANAVAAPSDDGFSLGGVATKFSMVHEGQRYVIRTGSRAGEVIAKLPSTKYPDLVRNEALCYQLAEALHINTAKAQARPITEIDVPQSVRDTFTEYLHVPRFDRQLQPNGQYRRVHFEELIQAIGLDAKQKYKDLPAAMVALLTVLKQSPASGFDEIEEVFRRWTAYALMGNTDAHSKNWGLLYPDGRHAVLAPAYDMVCVSAYFDDSDPLALAQNRKMDESLRKWGPDEAEALARKAGIIRFNQIRKVVRDTQKLAVKTWPAILDQEPGRVAENVRQRLEFFRIKGTGTGQ